jgi:hypothetical protein
MVSCFSSLCKTAKASSQDISVGGGVDSCKLDLIIAKPLSDGVLVTGKHAEAVLVTGLGKDGEYLPLVDEGTAKADDGLWVAPLPDGVVAFEAPA